jgi:hypothetical protein
MKHFTDQEIEDAIKKAPKFIQDEISSGEDTAVIIAEIGRRFGLHIDIVGTIAKLNRNMLLGFVNPQEFINELIVAKISDKDARDIMTEINQKIFVPLRERMRSGEVEVKAAPPAKPAAVTPVASLTREKNYAPPLQSPMYSRPINKFPLTPPAAGLPSVPKREESVARPVQPMRTSVSNIPPVRPVMLASPKQTDSSKLLEDHEELHIEFNKAPMAMTPSLVIPPSTRSPQGINRIAAPAVQSAPIATKIKLVVPTIDPKPIPPFTPAASAPKTPPTHQKPYSTDPYREPIE